MNDDLAQALQELRKVLALPTVGRSTRSGELTELRRLIESYPDEARVILREVAGDASVP
ncbi:hypothetical protein NE236_37475 [Actinoallomurus purpureus]|uniref:hypothetical protein n=1 Tax=Actinoallomurus purpureus TaxID=478114 RepID=UPI0020936D08|nr:hypothetical protein [Actinoallomurus purpureus]MCO6010664.1 hypothetical protein [Actinoallomurus purpureus]